jgi:hypothetical protein
MVGFDSLMDEFVTINSFEKENVEVFIKPDAKSCDPNLGIFDNGLLLSIIDTFTSFAGGVMLEKYKQHYSVSVSLNITSFDDMTRDNEYIMRVWLKSEANDFIYYDFEIFEHKTGRLVKKGYHLKKKSRFGYKF